MCRFVNLCFLFMALKPVKLMDQLICGIIAFALREFYYLLTPWYFPPQALLNSQSTFVPGDSVAVPGAQEKISLKKSFALWILCEYLTVPQECQGVFMAFLFCRISTYTFFVLFYFVLFLFSLTLLVLTWFWSEQRTCRNWGDSGDSL